jgi:hypothetical protein
VGIVGRLLAPVLLLFLRRRRRFDDPFTGLPQLYWWTWRTKALPLVVLFVCLMPSVAVGMALSSAPGGLVAKFVRLWNAGPEPSLMILGFMLLVARIEIVVRMSLPLNNLANFVTGTSRHLRVLPVASSRLVAFLIFRRAAGWANLWAAAMIMHLLVAGVPSQLRLDWLVCVIGVDTLLDAATYYGSRVLLVSTYGLVASAWFVVAYGVNWSADSLVTASVPVVAVLVGAVAFAAAVVAHRWSVTSGTGLYQSEGVA